MSTVQASREQVLGESGIRTTRPIHWNLGTAALYEHAIRRQEGEHRDGWSARLQDGRAHRAVP